MSKIQKQIQQYNQQQIISQSYANSILFMNLSCLESIKQKYQQKNNGPKFFGAYDIVDYSHRQLPVLKEQFRLGLYQVQISYDHQKQKGKKQFILPNNYNMQQVLDKLEEFGNFFQEKDQQCYDMIEDLKNILQNKNAKQKYTDMKFTSEKSKSFAQNVENMLKSNDKITEQQRKIKKFYKPDMKLEDISFRNNPNYTNKKKRENEGKMNEQLLHKQPDKKMENKGIKKQKSLWSCCLLCPFR